MIDKRCLLFYGDDFAAFVIPALTADLMGSRDRVALGAKVNLGSHQSMVGTAHVSFGSSGLIYWNSHDLPHFLKTQLLIEFQVF